MDERITSRWSVERDVGPSGRLPHILCWDGGQVFWVSPEKADEMQRLIDAAAAPVPPEGGRAEAEARSKVYAAAYGAGWDDAVAMAERHEPAAPPAPPESLPVGVRAGYVLDSGMPVPEGWQRINVPSARGAGTVTDAVERIPSPPEPETVLVSWQQSIGRTLPDGKKIIGADETTICPRIKFGTARNATYKLVSDGLVSVLVES